MLKKPGFILIAVITLALGIGANTAIFSVVYAVLLRPLHYPQPEQLITVWSAERDGRTWGLTAPEFFDLRERNQVCEEMAAYQTGAVNLVGGDEPERVAAASVSAGLFPLLGVQPLTGRVFLPEEDQPGQDRVVALSYDLWQRRFGAEPRLLGQQVNLDGLSRTVIGIMPRGFQFPNPEVGLWIPLALERAKADPLDRSFSVVARLKSGVKLEQARVELNGIAQQLLQEYARRFPKGANTTPGVSLVPLRELSVGDLRPTLWVLLAAVGFVLLVACANVAHLLLARAETRSREMALRAALGARRGRLVRQLLTESTLLAFAGGALGLWLASSGVEAWLATAPAQFPRAAEIGIDGRVLGFTLLVSLLTGILFGLAPALQISKTDLHTALKQGSHSSTASSGRYVARLLIISEAALALVLLAGAGLMIKSLWRLRQIHPGFSPGRVLTLRFSLPEAKYPTPQQVVGFAEQLIERVEALPGVQRAGLVTRLPLSGLNANASFGIEGSALAPGEGEQNADYRIVTPGYFRALGIPLIRGRSFERRDHRDAPAVVIINETFARHFFPNEDCLGKRITLGAPGAPWLSIVGVVGDVRHRGVHLAAQPEMYFPRAQQSYVAALGVWRSMTLVVRAQLEPASLSSAVKNAVRALDPQLPVARIATMEQVLSASVAQPRLTMLLLVIFAALALLLAAVGLYGVMSYTVTQRRQEIGIRLALGASRGAVLKLVVGRGMRLALSGVAVGLIAAFALTRWMKSLLFGVSATDPVTLIGVATLLTSVALLAAYLPARRAARVDPLVALRGE
jgi:putative ABC transport system permease protein